MRRGSHAYARQRRRLKRLGRAQHRELRVGPPLTITKKNLDQYAKKF
jgi:hypothetical protein